jgi:hypothetical protein
MAILDAPGNFTIVLGDERAKTKLRRADGIIDDWLYELTDDVAQRAGDRLRANAPGAIDRLVSVDRAEEIGPGSFESIAGVESDTFYGNSDRGLGSNPQHYPIYVDQGTGIFGEKRSPIYTIPGNLMGPIRFKGRTHFVPHFKGQPAQHFSERSFTDTIGWTPFRIDAGIVELRRKIDA